MRSIHDPRTDGGALRQGTFIEQATPALVGLWRVLGRSWYWLAGLTALGLALGWVLGQMATPLYQATATVLIEAARSKVVSIEEVSPGLSSDREHYRTQTQFMKSREVALRVIRDLNLVSHPAFAELAAGKTKGGQEGTGGSGADGAPATPAVIEAPGSSYTVRSERSVATIPAEERVLAQLMAGLTIEPIRQSQLVLVKFTSEDPVLAARIANRVAESFIQAEMDMRLQVTIAANAWLAERVAELKTNVDISERALAESREAANLLESRGNVVGAGLQTENVNQRLAEARVRRAEAEQAYQQVRPGVAGRENAPAIIASAGVQRARDAVADAQARFSDASSRFGSQHPEYRASELALANARSYLNQQVESAIASINKDYQLAMATEVALQRTVDQTRKSALSDNRKEAQVAILQQEAETNRQIYQTFLSRLKETAAAGDVQTPQARLVDSAVAPTTPVSPRKVLLLAGFGLVGLLLGSVIAIFRAQTDTKIRSIEEVEATLGEPVITTLPLLDRRQQRHRGLLVVGEPRTFFSEMMRMGAASVQFSLLDGERRSVAITSTVASEGKSTVAANLALSLSRTNRVILIDGDLYRPNVHRLLPVDHPDRGLAQVLLGDVPLRDAIQRVSGTQLEVIPAGAVHGNAFSAATPSRMRRLVKMLEAKYDIVILDAPPIEVVSDGLMMSTACAGAILVTRSGTTPIMLVQRSLKRLRRLNARILGIVLNGHDYLSAERFYGEKSSYRDYESYARGPDERDNEAATLAERSKAMLERLGAGRYLPGRSSKVSESTPPR